VATFTTTGASVKVGSVAQVSGSTANDFTHSVVYTVAAADGTSANYTVTVAVGKNTAKAITAFSLAVKSVKSDGVIDESKKIIAVGFPFGTDVSSLVATFATTGASVKLGGVEQVSGTTANDFTHAVVYTVTAADGSSVDYTVKVTVAPSSAKAITAFSLASTPGAIDEPNKAIAVTLPFDSDVTALVATFSTTGAKVSVDTVTQVSGKTPNDFSTPVVYTVSAADGSSVDYTVTVTVAKNPAKAITAFSLATGSVASVGSINEPNKTISVNAPFGTAVTALVATFTTTGASVKVGGVQQVSGTTANDFTHPVVYTVSAADGSSVNYTVTVTVGKNPAKAITAFSLANGTVSSVGTIDEPGKTIAVNFGSGTDVTKLVATFATTGTSVKVGSVAQVSGKTPNDFTKPVVYTVTAADGSSVDYTVTVAVIKSTTKAITAFALAFGYVKSAGTIDEANKTIAVSFPADIGVTNLVATFATTGVSVTLGAVVQASGVGAHDFTSPVVYTVTAEDGSSVDYTVTVTHLPVIPPGPTQAPNFRIDAAHTAGQPGETLAPPLKPAWSYDAGQAVNYPLVADGRVFITTANMVTALDTQSGAVVWGPNALGDGLLHAYDSGRLFVLTKSGLLMALDASNGVQLWSASLQGQLDFWSPPVAADGVVYVNGLESGGTTYAVDAATGALLWTGGTFDGSNGAVAIGYGGVYEAEACSQTTAWWAHDGSQLWHYSTGCTGGGGAAPALYRHRLYVRDWAAGNTILDITTGTSVGSWVGTVPPAFSDGIGYYLQKGTLRGITTDTSTVKWSFAGDGALTSAPVVAGPYAYVGSSSGNLYALDGHGQQVWTTKLAAGINSAAETNSMAVAEGTLLVPAGNTIYAFVAQ
jgi:outer membrane protein assembly factor BamB